MDDPLPLTGYTIGVTAERRREELGDALARRGATPVYGPAIHLVPLADDTELRAAIERCLTAPLDYAIATTGVGFRGWLEAARAAGHDAALHDALSAATILARGPKAVGAIRGEGLRESWSPASESSDEVLAHLLDTGDLAGRRIAIQLHGDPLREVIDALRDAGADVVEVPVYRWRPPDDPEPLRDLIRRTADVTIDCVTFTSAPATANFLQTAQDLNLAPAVVTALQGPVLAAAVGPVTAAPLVAVGIDAAQPPRSRLGALVRDVTDRLADRPPVAGRGDEKIPG